MDINRDNYETFFLLYLDRELDPSGMKTVERFLNENEDLQKEFAVLQQTVLVPAEIVFEPKQTLFRKEEKRKIVPFYRMRVAAAVAALILGGWFITNRVMNSRTSIATGNNPTELVKNSPDQSAEKLKSAETKNKNDQHVSPADNLPGAEKIANSTTQQIQAGNKKDQNQKSQTPGSVTRDPSNSEGNSQADLGNKPSVRDQSDLAFSGSSGEDITAVQKNSSGLELQTGESVKTGDPKQMAAATPGKQAPAVLIASAGVKNVHEENVLQESDFQSDNAISVVALNNKNKGITGFFNKITKRAPDDANTRKVRVSVFQFSY